MFYDMISFLNHIIVFTGAVIEQYVLLVHQRMAGCISKRTIYIHQNGRICHEQRGSIEQNIQISRTVWVKIQYFISFEIESKPVRIGVRYNHYKISHYPQEIYYNRNKPRIILSHIINCWSRQKRMKTLLAIVIPLSVKNQLQTKLNVLEACTYIYLGTRYQTFLVFSLLDGAVTLEHSKFVCINYRCIREYVGFFKCSLYLHGLS